MPPAARFLASDGHDSPLDLLPQLLAGAVVTIQLTSLGAIVAAALRWSPGLARLSPQRDRAGHRDASTSRSSAARPRVVQIFFFFFVLPAFGIVLPAFWTGVFALGINVGAYGSEVVRAAILERGPRPARRSDRAQPDVGADDAADHPAPGVRGDAAAVRQPR